MTAMATLGACAGPSAEPVAPIGVDIAPTATCDGRASSPQIVATSPAVLPADAWTRTGEWESRLTFRIDASGTPLDVRTTDAADATDSFAAASVAALADYRFCAPQAFSSETRWRAVMRFRRGAVGRAAGGGAMIVQMFVPAYTRADVVEKRTGTVRVTGTFAADGRATAVRLASSSGDAVLDRKSLEAMASWQLVFAPGTTPTRPIVYQQPYTYAIR